MINGNLIWCDDSVLGVSCKHLFYTQVFLFDMRLNDRTTLVDKQIELMGSRFKRIGTYAHPNKPYTLAKLKISNMYYEREIAQLARTVYTNALLLKGNKATECLQDYTNFCKATLQAKQTTK